MSGKEIKDYLEYSYDAWINTISSSDEHLLKIVNEPDPRTGQKRWSFVNRSYNFDSAGGLIYTVDVTKPAGERVCIESLADGSSFDETAEYNVAMTSYRASGGGGIMRNGAGVDTDKINDRVVEYYPEIRNILYDYLLKNSQIDPEVIGDRSVIGEWTFVPETLASKAMDKDMQLLFPKR
jgi:2',3'-cyclic-nucleotide 2'-phosphodiesterase/3'-nucleotidase